MKLNDCTKLFQEKRRLTGLEPIRSMVVRVEEGLQLDCGCQVTAVTPAGFTLKHCPKHAARWGEFEAVGHPQAGAALNVNNRAFGLVEVNLQAGKFPHEMES